MNVANTVSVLRIWIAPLFFVLFFLSEWIGVAPGLSILPLWIIYIVSEISDAVDGGVARAFNQVSDVGKLLDPFADIFAHLTFFLCFVIAQIMPAWAFLVILYRELGMVFLRMLMIKDGYAMAAKIGGKVKTVLYAVSCALGLAVHSVRSLDLPGGLDAGLAAGAQVVFVLAAAASFLSFVDYYSDYRRRRST